MPSDALAQVAHVIDDDEAVRQSIEFLLRSAKIDVKVYESAESVRLGPDGVDRWSVRVGLR